MVSSTKMSRMPVLEKSSSVVSSVTLAAGCSPRAASTASAVATDGAADAEAQRVDLLRR